MYKNNIDLRVAVWIKESKICYVSSCVVCCVCSVFFSFCSFFLFFFLCKSASGAILLWLWSDESNNIKSEPHIIVLFVFIQIVYGGGGGERLFSIQCSKMLCSSFIHRENENEPCVDSSERVRVRRCCIVYCLYAAKANVSCVRDYCSVCVWCFVCEHFISKIQREETKQTNQQQKKTSKPSKRGRFIKNVYNEVPPGKLLRPYLLFLIRAFTVFFDFFLNWTINRYTICIWSYLTASNLQPPLST